MRHILPFLKPYRGQIALAMALIAVATVCDLLLPTIMSELLEQGVRQSDFPCILRCCGRMFLVAMLGLGTLVLGRRSSARVEAGFAGDIRAQVFKTVNEMSFAEFNRLGAAALVTRSTHDVGTVSWVASMISGSLITIPVLFIGGVALAMGKDPALSLILLAFVPLVFLAVFLVGRGLYPLYEKSDRYIDLQNDIMRERLHGIRVIRAFNREQQEQDKIAAATHVMAENIINANVRMGLVSPLAILLLNIAVLLILYVGGGRIEAGGGSLTGSGIFAIVQYVALVANGVLMAGMAVVMLPHANVAAQRIGQVLETQGLKDENPEEDRRFQGGLSMEHVSFRYEDAAEYAIRDISISIAPGERVAIIGGTGSGKSSLVQMLLAFRLPTEGTIRFDGADAKGINRRVIRRNISCVLQKAALYSGSIRHNIQMGRPGASQEEILQAADIAQLSDLIQSLPGGLDYQLTQGGKNLSGGQKQRLCIARAILKDAPIYIFDDSFSALDFLTEARLRARLNERTAGKTQILITQRIASAMGADRIFVMDRGRLVDQGKHGELMERCAIYREIYASQTGKGGTGE